MEVRTVLQYTQMGVLYKFHIQVSYVCYLQVMSALLLKKNHKTSGVYVVANFFFKKTQFLGHKIFMNLAFLLFKFQNLDFCNQFIKSNFLATAFMAYHISIGSCFPFCVGESTIVYLFLKFFCSYSTASFECFFSVCRWSKFFGFKQYQQL